MDILTKPLRRYTKDLHSPKSVKNYDELYEGRFVHLIVEETPKGQSVFDAIDTYLEKNIGKNVIEDDTLFVTDTYLKRLVKPDYDLRPIIDQFVSEPNVYYMGCLHVAHPSLEVILKIILFKKSLSIPTELYDPPIRLKEIKIDNTDKKINIISDNYIIGGTKTRALVPYLNEYLAANPDLTELLYLGASNGYAQVALSYALYLLKSNVKGKIYFQFTNLSEAKKLQSLAMYINPSHISYVPMEKPLKEIWPIMEAEVQADPIHKVIIPFGLHEVTYERYFKDSLRTHLIQYVDKIKRLWIVGGSGTLFGTLYDILPHTHFMVVQVGKEVKSKGDRMTVLVSSYKLYESIKTSIPYLTLNSYDGKIWEFADQFQDDDYVWNVGGIHNII